MVLHFAQHINVKGVRMFESGIKYQLVKSVIILNLIEVISFCRLESVDRIALSH